MNTPPEEGKGLRVYAPFEEFLGTSDAAQSLPLQFRETMIATLAIGLITCR